MEGVPRREIKLLPHNPAWDAEFLQTKAQLTDCLQDNIIDIQHVGSTAIPAICAKPILDVAVKLESIHDMDIDALVSHGYDYRGAQGGNDHYHLFVLRNEHGLSLRHIHCYDKNEKEFDLLVGFRDYLNLHFDEAKKYEALKQKLSEKYADNRPAYTKGKEDFIRSVYAKLSASDCIGK